MATYKLIEKSTVGAGGASSVTLGSGGTIPQTYSDIVVKLSARNTSAVNWYALKFEFNGSTTGYTQIITYNGSGTPTSISRSDSYSSYLAGTNATASTFSNFEFYVPSYTSSNYKSFSIDWVNENNSSTYIGGITNGLWSNSAAITSISFSLESSGSFPQYSTFYLYGVLKA